MNGFAVYATEEFAQHYKELPRHIQLKAERRETLFRANPFHPSLHTEKLHPKAKEVWSFRIDENYRVLFRFADTRKIYLLTVGPHHWIYRYMTRV